MFGNKIRLVKTPTQFRRAKCVAPNCICEFELKAVLDVLEGHGWMCYTMKQSSMILFYKVMVMFQRHYRAYYK